jgi:hypothetical protein
MNVPRAFVGHNEAKSISCGAEELSPHAQSNKENVVKQRIFFMLANILFFVKKDV